MKIETVAVHAGDRKAADTYVPTTTPIFAASSYSYPSINELERVFAGEQPGQGYKRFGNPTTQALEELLCRLEEGDAAVATASGMAALHLALTAALIDRPKRILAAHLLFGDTFRLLNNVLEGQGIEITYADCCDVEGFTNALREFQPGCVLVEAVSNPILRVAPLDLICAAARAAGAISVVDATFLTPFLARPLTESIGADYSVHSVTKYFAGHADVLGGAVITHSRFEETLRPLAHTLGPNLDPFASYLTMRGIKTLPLRMARQCSNAARIADWLGEHPRIEAVHYPGLESHPDHATARRLFSDGNFGGMVSFAIRGAGRKDVFRFMNALEIVIPATSLGDVHSLISHPAISSHRNLPPKQRERLGIGENLVRMSAGIEDCEDILADLGRALAA